MSTSDQSHPKLPALAVLAGLATLFAAGCNVGPRYSRPQVPVPPTIRGADDAQVASPPATSIGDQKWSEVFREPELQALIATALKNNFDLRVAAERVLEQQAQVRITRSQEFPTITAGGLGVGALLVGALNDHWTPRYGQAAIAHSLLVPMALFLPAAGLYALACLFIRRDVVRAGR